MIISRLKDIVEEIRKNPPPDTKESFSLYRIQKDSGIAYSTLVKIADAEPLNAIYAHVLEGILTSINKRRNPITPEYTLNDLLEMVSESDLAKRRRPRKKRNG